MRSAIARRRHLSRLPIVERDDGQFQIGLGDNAPGPFPSRKFAEMVAIEDDPPPISDMRCPAGVQSGRGNRKLGGGGEHGEINDLLAHAQADRLIRRFGVPRFFALAVAPLAFGRSAS